MLFFQVQSLVTWFPGQDNTQPKAKLLVKCLMFNIFNLTVTTTHICNARMAMLECLHFYVEILNNINSMFIPDLHSSRNLLSPACKQPSPVHPPWRLGESCRNKLLQNKYGSFVATERTVFLSYFLCIIIHYYFKTAPDKQTSSWQIMRTLSRLCKTISCGTTGV